jgi:hypothetical protein
MNYFWKECIFYFPGPVPIIKKVPVYKTVVVREKVAVPKPGKSILKHEMEPFTKTLFNMVFLCYI